MRVYFDMDGVLADFEGGMFKKFGVTKEMRDKARNRAKFDDELFAKVRADAHFYRDLEPIPEMPALLREAIARIGVENVAILTAEPRPERGVVNAAEDKRAWIREHVGADVEVIVVQRGVTEGGEKEPFGASKARFAAGSPDNILIDDNKGYIKAWEAAGGAGILHVSAEETRAALVGLGVL